jgi:hypothetical protein
MGKRTFHMLSYSVKGFGLRRSNYLVPLMSNNIVISGEEAVAQQIQPAFKINSTTKREIISSEKSERENMEPNMESLSELDDEKIMGLIEEGKVLSYRLEQDLKDCERAVEIRRKILRKNIVQFC